MNGNTAYQEAKTGGLH